MPFTKLCTASVMLASLALFTVPAQANLSQQQSAAIIKAYDGSDPADFRQFLGKLAGSNLAKADKLDATLKLYLAGKPLAAEQQDEIHRLLGLYTRIKYGKAATETLRQLVEIPTYRKEGVPQHENPEFLKFADKIKALAEGFGLTFRNIDNRVYEITLGEGKEVIGIHAHADVVPVTPENWKLEDGTKLDPFKVTLVGDRMYGRGTEDDKNGIVVALYALKVAKDEKLPLARQFKLLVDTTEETTGDAIPYYFERNATPDYNLALDGGYPVVIAEKGYGTIMATFTKRAGTGKGAEVVNLTGGLATNQIPGNSVATLTSDQPQDLAKALEKAGGEYVKQHGGDFKIDAKADGKHVLLTVTGVSAHSSEPESGVNPVARMLDFLDGVQKQVPLKHNHITDAARYAAHNWGLDYLGNKLGVGFKDDFMGPLTASLTFVGLDDKALKLAVNLRIPRGKSLETLKTEISDKLGDWARTSHTSVAFAYTLDEPMYRNPEGEWVKALLAVASENLGMKHEYGTSAGATSVHDLPNGVQFGLAMPDVKYSGHNDNEFKTVGQFMLDLQIVSEMVARIGQMPKL
ncbi:dipeptidase [Pseudomonas sp. GD03858]|uniref:dipeptidase n=1 Tax=unclassified Pseudomonas TaxID=196821 RepID=UPI00244BEF9A|nr:MULTISPECIES: dipeptidase [unclassified Pseudomonas]MDH0646566.1 dipeptidase [Pseudomonas sp. GD03867]MDH0663623.1 dipeptidase [Pseudomonas sp. GD03858]